LLASWPIDDVNGQWLGREDLWEGTRAERLGLRGFIRQLSAVFTAALPVAYRMWTAAEVLPPSEWGILAQASDR